MSEEKYFYKGSGLYYLEDDVSEFSVIEVYPELPYEELGKKDLDLYKKYIEYHRGTSPDYTISAKSREELYELYLYFSNLGYRNIKVKDISENDYNLSGFEMIYKFWQRRRFFKMEDIKKEFNSGVGRNSTGELSTEELPSFMKFYLRIRVDFKDLEKFINEVKNLKSMKYKNYWLFPGHRIWDDDWINNKYLIA